MSDSRPSKRRRCNTSGSTSLERGSSGDFFLRSEDMLAPLRSEDVLLGSGLDALTSVDIVKNILLPELAAGGWLKNFETESRDLVAMHPSLFLGNHPSSFKGDAREASTSPLPLKPRTYNCQEHSMPLQSLGSKPASLPFLTKTRMSSGDWVVDFITDFKEKSVDLGPLDPSLLAATYRDVMAGQSTASSPPLNAPLAGHLACRPRSSAPAPSADSAPSPESARMSSGDWIAKFVTEFKDESADLGPLDPSLLAATYRDAMAGQSAASPPPSSAPLVGHLARHPRSSTPAPPATSADKTSTPLSAPATTKKKQNRKRMLDETTVAEPSEGDVLSGRGGHTNIHPGNVRFREKALELRPWYEESSKEKKQEIADILVEFVRDGGNRFLGKGKDGLWHEMIGNGPHFKASQALRERIRGRIGD